VQQLVLGTVDVLQLYRKGTTLNLSVPCSVLANACTSPEPDEYRLYPVLPASMSVCPCETNLTIEKGFQAVFLEKKSAVCDSMLVHYHLQWNVSSVNKPNIPFIFMGVKCDFLH